MLIDTHTHVPNLDGVAKIIFSATGPGGMTFPDDAPDDARRDYGTAKVLGCARENPHIYCTLGIHPDFFYDAPDYEHLLNDPKVVGIGEIGLDYHEGTEHKAGQIALFERQVEIARRAKLPVAVHSRGADDDTIGILRDAPGVMHCFTGSWDFARIMLGRGFYFSASGILTFKNAQEIRDVFARIPIDRLVAETDSPFCAPVPYRGRPARPAMMIETVRVLARIRNIAPIEMENILWNNSHKLYPKLNNGQTTY